MTKENNPLMWGCNPLQGIVNKEKYLPSGSACPAAFAPIWFNGLVKWYVDDAKPGLDHCTRVGGAVP